MNEPRITGGSPVLALPLSESPPPPPPPLLLGTAQKVGRHALLTIDTSVEPPKTEAPESPDEKWDWSIESPLSCAFCPLSKELLAKLQERISRSYPPSPISEKEYISDDEIPPPPPEY